jgi:glucose/mannose-6-phosphate isomerase
MAELAQRGRAVLVTAPGGRQPRASVFALATPLLVAGDALGLLSCSPEEVEATAVLLEQLAARNRPDAELVLNPGKALALALLGRLPVAWGTSALGGVAAYRFACQLNENAKTPGVWGALPEAGHNQVVALDGPFARTDDEDLFLDRLEDEEGGPRMHVVLLRDSDEHPRVAHRADVVTELARERGVPVSVVQAEGSSPFQRVASLVHVVDWATAYLALAQGIDPTPVGPIDELKQALAR